MAGFLCESRSAQVQIKVPLRPERYRFCPCDLQQDVQVRRLVDQWNQCEVDMTMVKDDPIRTSLNEGPSRPEVHKVLPQ